MGEIHPARLMDFDTMYAAICDREARGLVKRQTDGDLAIFNYTKKCQFDKAWDEITTITRGLVLDTVSKRVVATSFPKFFNLGERKDFYEPDEPMDVWEKVDGSLGVILCSPDGFWRVDTRGSFTSPQAAAGQRILDSYGAGMLANLLPGCTYLVEIVAPESRVIIPYEGERLVLLGAYTAAGKFKSPCDVLATSCVPFSAPKLYDMYTDIKDVTAAVGKLPATEEGFVCYWPRSGVRVKVKGPAYVAAHRAASKCRPLDVWALLRDGTQETRDAARAALTPGLQAEYDKVVGVLTGLHEEEVSTLYEWFSPEPPRGTGSDRKEFAQRISLCSCKHIQRALWALYDDRMEAAMKHIWDKIRPDGNLLPGYTPSLAMHNIDEATP